MNHWRPRNETDADLERESEAAKRIEQAFQRRLVKLSEALYHVDWAIFREDQLPGPRLTGFAEYKRRLNDRGKYHTLIISAAKVMKGLSLARDFGVRFLLFIEWDDGIFWIEAEKHEGVRLGGNHRGQNGDMEPVVHYPIEEFRSIEKRQ